MHSQGLVDAGKTQGLAALQCGDHEQATARSLEARDAAGASGELLQHGGPLMVLANIAESKGDHGLAQQLYDESIDVHRRAGELWGLAILLSAAAGVRGDFDGARNQASEAISLAQELEDPRGIAWSIDVFAGCLPQKDTPTERPGCGALQTGCWKALAARSHPKFDGSEIATSSP